MGNITSISNFKTLRIFIDDILHIDLPLENHDGLQAWFEHVGQKSNAKYFIDLYRKTGNTISLEYSKKEDWINVLKEFEKSL